MSHNLECKEVELWQTPTWVTDICLSNMDGGWQGVLFRYKVWVKSFNQGMWKSHSDLEDMNINIADHIEKLNWAIKKNKQLTFYRS